MDGDFRKFIFSGDITRRLDLQAQFGLGRRIEVDVGCGMGRFILARAAAHPEVQFIGIERLKPRVEKIAKKALRRGLDNVFIIRLEATYVLRYLLPEHSISRFYLFFPDPWPKRRHAGHRVFNAEFRSLIWSRLADGGDLQVATDSEDYFADMVSQMATDPRYERIPAVERTDEERTDFELIFLGQGLTPGASGFRAKSAQEIGEEQLARCAAEDAAREEAFWTEEMPHSDSVHIVGIGGVGMSAVAQAYLDAGAEVTGSDRLADSGDVTGALKALVSQGVSVFPQDGSGIGDATTKVVVSTAIEDDNPDLLAAHNRGIEVIHRSAAVEELSKGKRLIAVAGTSGKSTTTAMLGWILAYAGLDPSVINGAAIVGWDDNGARVGSVRRGDGEWCVIEADESDKSFLRFKPEHAIITNESADHFDLEATKELFSAFRKRVSGTIVENTSSVTELLPSTAWKTRFRSPWGEYSLRIPGAHNAWNACQAAKLAIDIGIDPVMVRRALLTFPGVERRLQRVGETKSGSVVVDDYGHNPAKLSAAMATVAEVSGKMAVLWRPHGYGPLRHMLDGLSTAFASNLRPDDVLYLLPVYDAGGTADRTINTDALLGRLAALGVANAYLVGSIDEARTGLESFAEKEGSEAALLICGARDPDLPRLAKSLCDC